MVVDLPAPLGPMKPSSSPDVEAERHVGQGVNLAPAPAHEATQRAAEADARSATR